MFTYDSFHLKTLNMRSESELIRMGRRGKRGGGVDAMNVDWYIVDDGCKKEVLVVYCLLIS